MPSPRTLLRLLPLGLAAAAFCLDKPPVVVGRWTSLAGVYPGVDGTVRNLLADADGTLWVAGDFSQAGDGRGELLAQWKDGRWSMAATGFWEWNHTGSIEFVGIKRHPMGGILMAANLHDLSSDVLLYQFSSTANVALSRNSGMGCQAPFHAQYRACSISAFDFDPSGHPVVAGIFSFPSDSADHLQMAKWNDTAWVPTSHPKLKTIRGLQLDSSSRMLAWGPGLARQTAGGWEWVGMDSAVASRISIASLIVDGPESYTVSGNLDALGKGWRIAQWNGALWKEVGRDGNDTLRQTDLIADIQRGRDGRLVICGSFTRPSGSVVPLVAWNGTRWDSLAPAPRSASSMAVLPDGSFALGGSFEKAGDLYAGHVVRIQSGAVRSFGEGAMGTIKTAIPDGQGGWIVGGAVVPASNTVPPPRATRPLHSLFGKRIDGLAHLKDGIWSPMGDTVDGPVTSLARAPDGSFYVGGWFSKVGNDSVRGIARWNGANLERVGDGLPAVNKLAFDDHGILHAAGSFNRSGNAVVNCLARWNGSAWESIKDSAKLPTAEATDMALLSNGNTIALYEGSNRNGLGVHSTVYSVPGLDSLDSRLVWSSTNGWPTAVAAADSGRYLIAGRSLSNSIQAGAFAVCDTSRCTLVPSYWTGANSIYRDPHGIVFLGGTFGTDAAILRWDGTDMVAIGGIGGTIESIVPDGDTALIVLGDLTGPGGSTMARLSNPYEPAVGVSRRTAARPGAFAGAGAFLATTRAGSLEVYGLTGRLEQRRDVPAGFRLSDLPLGKGAHLARLEGQTVRWTRF